MTEQWQIERATAGDLEAIRRLLLAQFDEHDIETEGQGLNAAIARVFEEDRWGLFVVARQAGEVVGVAAVSLAWTLEHGGLSAWLDELYVLPERRGQGLGTALLHRAVEEARALGCAAVDLEVDRDHLRAEGLYRREGFRPLPRLRWVQRLK
jgi:GNAT superfamily N-acetyltransferase